MIRDKSVVRMSARNARSAQLAEGQQSVEAALLGLHLRKNDCKYEPER